MKPQKIEEKDLMKTYNDFRHYGDFVNREDYEKLCMTKISFKYQGKTAVFTMERGEVIRGTLYEKECNGKNFSVSRL